MFVTLFNYSEYLGSSTTVFQAEIAAITRVATFLGYKQALQKIIIRSDSQAAIQAIKSNTITSPLVEECIKALNFLGEKNSVTLQWIKAHVGHEGNEAADQFAKQGTKEERSGPDPFLPVPQAYIDQKIERKTDENWNKRWSNLNTCKQTKLWYKNITNSKKFNRFLKEGSRKDIGRIVQLITGHCNLRKHKHFYDRNIDPQCRFCNQKLETPWHIITECPSFMNIRGRIFHGSSILHSFAWSPKLLLRFRKESKLWSMLEDQE